MAAKIIVIVENQNPRIIAHGLLEKVCSRKTTESCADDDQVELFPRVLSFPGRAIKSQVRRFE